jgi:mannan polymerase II complex ANP1 subunit
MEQERIARENEEKERADRMKKIKDQFDDPNSQWEKDKTDIQNEALKEKKEKEKEESSGNAAAKADDSKVSEAKANELPKV